MPRAFRATIYRLLIFFIGSALAIGILVPYNDELLLGAQSSGAAGGGQSPYIISMQILGISVLPDIVNALIITSVFSAVSSCGKFACRHEIEHLYSAGQCLHVRSD